MKTVFKSRELPHIWASQSAPHGRCSSSESFQGQIYRSYSTDIARILEPGRVVLHNVTSYSVTTSSHQSAARVATSHFADQFHIGGLDRGEVLRVRGGGRAELKELGAHVYLWNLHEAAKYQAKATRARTNGAFYLEAAEKCIAEANRASVYFKLGKNPVTLEKATETVRKVTAAQARKDAKAAKEQEERFARERAERLARYTDFLTDWRAGHLSSGSERYDGGSRDYWATQTAEGFEPNAALRLSEERDRVETSQGAQVLVRTVKFLWAFCRTARQTATAADAATVERFPKLDHYQLQDIDARGNVTVGCHRIAFEEVESIAKALSLPPFNGAPAELPSIPEQVTAG